MLTMRFSLLFLQVDSLRTRLLEKLQHFVGDLQLEATVGQTTEVDTEQPIKVGKVFKFCLFTHSRFGI